MDQVQRLFFAASSLAFCLLFIIGMLVYGNSTSRALVLGAALAGALSQFLAQDPRGASVANAFAMVGFALALVALLALGLA